MEKFEVTVTYFAGLRDQAGVSEEVVSVERCSVFDLYQSLMARHGFDIAGRFIQFAVNSSFVQRDYAVAAGDHVVFIPPVSGG